MPRKVCLAIGVSTVLPPGNEEPAFAYLDGAIFAARAIGAWALSAGFGPDNILVIDDAYVDNRPNPVTRDLVQKAVNTLFPEAADTVEHMVLAFCGHGLTDENAGSISWLFSDSLKAKYRVVANRFYGELLLNGVERLTLISDACREAPRSIELMRLDSVRGIAVQGVQVASPKVDRLTACQDGKLGYMVVDPAATTAGKCVFSGVVVDALWGLEPTAIVNGQITTTTLSTCVEKRASERGQEYHLTFNPECVVHPMPAVLCESNLPSADSNALQAWPPSTAVTSALGETLVEIKDLKSNDIVIEVNTNSDFRKDIFGTQSAIFSEDVSESYIHPTVFREASRGMLEDLYSLRRIPSTDDKQTNQTIDELVRKLEVHAATMQVDDARRAEAQRIRGLIELHQPASADENLIVVGGSKGYMSAKPMRRLSHSPGTESFNSECDPLGSPLLIQMDNGAYSQYVPYERLYCVLAPSDGGIYQTYGNRDLLGDHENVLRAIEDFASGRLNVSHLERLANDLRLGKHSNPTLGVLSAYLYSAISDFNSIQRMAYFFAERSQPVPYDIALLGAMRVSRADDGSLRLHVPAVDARTHLDGASDFPSYATIATPGVEAQIGGRCPWLGLGWDYVVDPRPEWSLLVEGLAEHASEVRRSGFTSLPNSVALVLAAEWGLQGYSSSPDL